MKINCIIVKIKIKKKKTKIEETFRRNPKQLKIIF